MQNIESPVIFETIATHCGHHIGTMTLNDPKAPNALSVDMCKLMSQQLSDWATDDNIVAILLKGSGERRLCRGQYPANRYDSMIDTPPRASCSSPIRTGWILRKRIQPIPANALYPKPLSCGVMALSWAVVWGLMAMCSHRIVTETTRFAMPEITIGLYPDATGSWFWRVCLPKLGYFWAWQGRTVTPTMRFFL